MELNANDNLPIARKSRPPSPSPSRGSGTSSVSEVSVATPRKDDCEFPHEETVSASELKVDMIKRLLSWHLKNYLM